MKSILFLVLIIISGNVFAQSISEVRKLREGDKATVTGIVTSGSEFGVVKYLQDASGGLAIYDEKLSQVKRGDSITVSGEINPYNNLFEITKVSNLTVHSSNHTLPATKVIDIKDIGEDYEGQLVEIRNVEITGSGTFAGNKNYNFSSGDASSVLRINSSSPIVGQVIPTNTINLIAIVSQYSFNSNDTRNGYQLLPRDMNDFVFKSTVNFTSPLEVKEITKNRLLLTWSTDVEATTEIRYGNNPDKSSWVKHVIGTSSAKQEGMSHEIEVVELNPSELIYVQAFSVVGIDTAFSSVRPFITASNSSGEIKVYFNSEINEQVSSGVPAMNVGGAMEDTLINYINRAAESIDFCIYNFNDQGLSNITGALNNASKRGVSVRVIACGTTNHYSTDDLDEGVHFLESPDDTQRDGIMHNKFIVFDANSPDHSKPWIWTGSTNLSFQQVVEDANHTVFIQDKSLALCYQIEFEEMWGSSSNTPNAGNAKYGADKSDNTPHEFIIGGTRVESYFSPSDNTNQKIIDAMGTANNDLNIESMVITRSDLARAIRDAKNRGVEVHVLSNYSKDNSVTVNEILDEVLPVGKYLFDDKAPGILHHKVAIVDANWAASDPQVITGSHNWSSSASIRNDENTLIIHDATIANQFFQQFAYRFAENGGNLYVSARKISDVQLNVFPNPVNNKLNIRADHRILDVRVFSTSGEIVLQKTNLGENSISLEFNAVPGMYLLRVDLENGQSSSYKVIKK